MQAPLKDSPHTGRAQVNPLTDPRAEGFLRHFFSISWARVLDAPRVGLARQRGREYPLAYARYLRWHSEVWTHYTMNERVDWLLARQEEIRYAR